MIINIDKLHTTQAGGLIYVLDSYIDKIDKII